MKQLSGAVKLFIVTRLAMYESPSQVVDAVKGEFGIDVTREHVRVYNPEQCEVAARWRKVFKNTRVSFHAKIENIPIANLAVRLKWLNDVARVAQRNGNQTVLMAAMRQAAEERGEVYTNKRNIGGVVGHLNLDDMSEAQLRHLANGGGVADLPR